MPSSLNSSMDDQGKIAAPHHLESTTPQVGRSHNKTMTHQAGKLTELEHTEEDEIEPELHWRTYLALAALFVLNLVQVFALSGPASLLTYIGEDLNNTSQKTWLSTSLSLTQAVAGPVLSFISDTFQSRKEILVVTSTLAFIGACIAPGSNNLYRVIVAQILVGIGFASAPLAYVIPSEILPRRLRPIAQSFINIAASLGAVFGIMLGGALTKRNATTGWRYLYWTEAALWGFTAVTLFFCYRPPKRQASHLDSLTFGQKLQRLDLPGMFLLSLGLAMLITGVSLGDNPYGWTSSRVLSTIIIGVLSLVAFALYEWKGTQNGILHHDLFRGGRMFPLCIMFIAIEGILLFPLIVFYASQTSALFESDPVRIGARTIPLYISSAFSTVLFGYWASKRRALRMPLLTGFVIFTAGIAAFISVQPKDSTNAVIFNTLAGIGFGGPLILVIAAVQLTVPHRLIATATAVISSSRAMFGALFTAIYGAVLSNRLAIEIPKHVVPAALGAGLPPSSLPAFIGALASGNVAAVGQVPGVNGRIIGAGVEAIHQALANGFRAIYIVSAPFGLLAIIGCFFIPDVSSLMDNRVQAPMEKEGLAHRDAQEEKK